MADIKITALTALTGFHYSGVTETITFDATDESPSKAFWSNGYAWGTMAQKRSAKGVSFRLVVLGGRLDVRKIVLTGAGEVELTTARTLTKGETLATRGTVN